MCDCMFFSLASRGIFLVADEQTISKHVGEESMKRIINWVLKYLSGVDIPVKR